MTMMSKRFGTLCRTPMQRGAKIPSAWQLDDVQRGLEPALEELMRDDTLLALMRSDRVAPQELDEVVEQARVAINAR